MLVLPDAGVASATAEALGTVMTEDPNTLVRSLHDLGAAAWFGGSLMGAIGVNGAANDIKDPADRARIAADGWARWAPVSAVAIGAHLLGGGGLMLAHRDRVRNQAGVGANTAIKTSLTVAALASTAYSGLLGARIGTATTAQADGGVKPGANTPDDIARTQQQLRILQWVTPALTGALIVLGAQQGEQQRPGQRVRGVAIKLRRRGQKAVSG